MHIKHPKEVHVISSFFRLAPFAIVFSLASGSPAAGTVHKCVGPNGQVTFQSLPCTGSQQAQTIEYSVTETSSAKATANGPNSINKLSKKADIQYYERKIKYAENQIESLRLAKQRQTDHWRGVMMDQENQLQTRKVEEIIASVSDDYNRRIRKAQKDKQSLEKRLKELKADN